MHSCLSKNILITGGAGFIGSNLAIKLYEKGYNVTVLDNLSEQIHGKDPLKSELYCSIKDKTKFINGSVTSREDWIKALEGQDVIVHLAAETGTGQSMYEISKYTSVNIGGTALMLDLLVKNKGSVKKVVVASSRAIYGEGKYKCNSCGVVYPSSRNVENMELKDYECKCPICNGSVAVVATTEDSQVHPTSVYGITKQVQEQMVMMVCPTIGVAPVAFRYQNVYGPGQSLSNPYTGILSIFSTRIKNGNDIVIFEDGKESRDFVYISDVVEGTIMGIEQSAADNNVFNIGLGVPVDVLNIANMLKENYSSTIKINVSGNYRLGDIRHNFADITKIKKLLKFAPKVSSAEGIKLFCQWVNTQSVQEDRYDTSVKEMSNRGLYK